MDLKRIFFLENEIMNYQWGSKTVIAELLGKPSPSPEPLAEMWMGAHPKAPSRVKTGSESVLLPELIRKYPEAILGKETAQDFGHRLPFLFKVLAACEPLSIQAHPDKIQASEGFARENEQNIPINDDKRNYKDKAGKPECICALTPFTALCGFREIDEIKMLFAEACGEKASPILNNLREVRDGGLPETQGLKYFFKQLMETNDDDKKELIEAASSSVQAASGADPALKWMVRIREMEKFKHDIGIFAPIFLNLVVLKPGQALFLPPGRLHAYLEGAAIELMANSDNTLRGGLTGKHVDLEELLKAIRFVQTPVEILKLQKDPETVYKTPADEFILSRINTGHGSGYHCTRKRSIEIAFCTQGNALISYSNDYSPLEIKKGDSLLIPALVENYRIEGSAVIYKAGVP